MAALRSGGKLYPSFTVLSAFWRRAGHAPPALEEGSAMLIGVAIAAFIALFGWGASYFGWEDPDGKVQLALAAAFILGCFTGFRGRGV